MADLHQCARRIAEFFNPGGEHLVTSVDIDGAPQDGPGDARITVVTRVAADRRSGQHRDQLRTAHET